MKKILTLLCTLLFSINLLAENTTTASSRINWLTNYEEALNQSNANSKPIFLLFTGSDWCTWCHKLEAEALSTQEFANAVGDKFIFVMVDFPSNNKLPAQLAAQNEQLKRKYGIRGFPTIVLINSKEQKIGNVEYRGGGGKQFAEQLLKIINDFSATKQKISLLEKQSFSGQELKNLYEKAQVFELFEDANKIVMLGIQSDQKPFFLLERYRFLANEGLYATEEALTLKKQLLNADPKNENFTHYHVALIDFEALSASQNHKNNADSLITPLANYIENFQNQDKSNLWRLHMIISQVYYDKDELDDALKHAKLSLNVAPLTVKPEIEIVIKNFEQQALPNSLANY